MAVLFCSTVSAGSGPRHVGQRAAENKCYETPRRNHFSFLPKRIVGVVFFFTDLIFFVKYPSYASFTLSHLSHPPPNCLDHSGGLAAVPGPFCRILVRLRWCFLNSRRFVQGGSASGTCALLNCSLRLCAFASDHSWGLATWITAEGEAPGQSHNFLHLTR